MAAIQIIARSSNVARTPAIPNRALHTTVSLRCIITAARSIGSGLSISVSADISVRVRTANNRVSASPMPHVSAALVKDPLVVLLAHIQARLGVKRARQRLVLGVYQIYRRDLVGAEQEAVGVPARLARL